MKLSPALIRQHLKEKYSMDDGRLLTEERFFARPLFYEKDEKTLPDRLYLAMQDAVPKADLGTAASSFFIIIRQDGQAEYDGFDNVLEISGSFSICQLFNDIQRIYDFYEEWEQMMNAVLHEEKDLQEMLDRSVKVFENPVTISTSDLSLIAHSSIMDEEPGLRELIKPDNLYEYGTAFMQDSQYAELRNKKEAFFYPEYITGYRSLCLNVFDRGVYRYRIAIPEIMRKFVPGDVEALVSFGGFISKILEKRSADGKENVHTLHHILLQVVENEEKELAQIEQELFEYGWVPEHRYVCMNFKVPMIDKQNMSVNFICKHIESLVHSSCAFQFESDIVVYINLTRFNGDTEDVFDKLVYFLRDSYLKAGISNEFSGFRYLRYYFKQASAALSTGSRRNIYQWIHRFDEVALDYLLEQSTAQIPAVLCSSEKLLELKEYDKGHNTEFYETLRVYLNNHLNAVQSAKELFIHRSTFLYRMDRIKELIGLETEDAGMMLYLMISYRLLDMQNL
ncbi:PucR family transcriptional regulator [Murimonas intestini]|uniref:PucR family transcriptional regulator n=1 Tax=Murimonas intestini TaxID=1337051 RepID=UPI0011DDA306|nr:helix-turn-helix domain-containing protein [Murimonas intestini]